MKRAGDYGYSPRQLARINARRQAKGRDILVDKKFGDPDYEQEYLEEEEEYAEKKNKPAMPAFPSKRPSALDNRPPSMESRRAIADEEFRRKTGRGAKGISTPMTKSAMERVMGTA
jgi:hypothetical protein